jgi:hypothetical protein
MSTGAATEGGIWPRSVAVPAPAQGDVAPAAPPVAERFSELAPRTWHREIGTRCGIVRMVFSVGSEGNEGVERLAGRPIQLVQPRRGAARGDWSETSVNGKRDDAISAAFDCDRDPRAAFARSTFVDIAPGTIAAGRPGRCRRSRYRGR